MQEHLIDEVVSKTFVVTCFAYNRVRLKDAVDFCQAFKALFPQPHFTIISVSGIQKVKLEGLVRELTALRFDFDEKKFYSQLKIKNKAILDEPKILAYYNIPDSNQALFADLGYYLCDFNSTNWKGMLEQYARKFC